MSAGSGGPSGRALTARSVLLSVLLGTTPPRLPVALLVSTTELFGIAEGTARTALSRMTAAGELVADGGHYALAADRLLSRQARQAASRRGTTLAWSPGDPWRQAVVAADGRRPAAERAALRDRMTGRRLAEVREGVWLRPDNLEDTAAVRSPEPGVVWFRAVPEDDPGALAARLWDLGAWAATARDLDARIRALVAPLVAGDRSVLADGFVLSAAVLRHFQADPLLPDALLPRDWPGSELRAGYDRFDDAYRAVLRTWFDEHR